MSRDPSICVDCNTEMTINQRQSTYVCQLCYRVAPYTCMNNVGQKCEEASARPHTEYHRKAHFSSYVKQFQAKENKDVPDSVIDTVTNDLKKMQLPADGIHRISTIRNVLQKHRLGTFYENLTQIWCRVNNRSAPYLTPEQEKQLYDMFDEIQEPYERHNSLRTNFVFYPYIFRKFCELQGYTHITEFLTRVKSRKRMGDNELLWKLICADLQWEFTPTAWL